MTTKFSIRNISALGTTELLGEMNLIFRVEADMTSIFPIYIYKYDSSKIIEGFYRERDFIEFYTYVHSNFEFKEEASSFIYNNIDAIQEILNSYDLLGKRFLFSIETWSPLVYGDFEKGIPNLGKAEELFYILDKIGNEDTDVITEKGYAKIFSPIEKSESMDKALFAAYSNLRFLLPINKGITTRGCQFFTVLSGLFSGVAIDDLTKELESEPDIFSFIRSRFTTKLDIPEVTPTSASLSNFNFDKLLDIFIQVEKQEKQKNSKVEEELVDITEISVSSIIDMGLDTFISKVKNPETTIKVTNDLSIQEIHTMYIRRGLLYICPNRVNKYDVFYEMFNSENIALVFS